MHGQVETPTLPLSRLDRGQVASCAFPLRMVAIGGGTGLPVLLRGMRTVCYPPSAGNAPLSERERDRLTAIVTVADDGGSSGDLRRAFRILAPGDIRNCLSALADDDSALRKLFDYRFNNNVGRHSLGNLILTALTHLEDDFPGAVERAAQLLAARGRVLPVTTDDMNLVAECSDGERICGESKITAARRRINRVCIDPAEARLLPAVKRAVGAADIVVIGPGSLYTSLIPPLLVNELADTIARSRCCVVLVMNLMTEPGETDDYSATDILRVFREHVPQMPIHIVLVNSAPLAGEAVARYAAEGVMPINVNENEIRAFGCRPVKYPLLAEDTLIRHDSLRLAHAMTALATGLATDYMS